MKLIHKGIKPLHELQVLDFKRKIYYEECLDGSYKLWTERQLNSGCDFIIREIKEMRGCIYCPWCDEWFSKNQWEECE